MKSKLTPRERSLGIKEILGEETLSGLSSSVTKVMKVITKDKEYIEELISSGAFSGFSSSFAKLNETIKGLSTLNLGLGIGLGLVEMRGVININSSLLGGFDLLVNTPDYTVDCSRISSSIIYKNPDKLTEKVKELTEKVNKTK